MKVIYFSFSEKLNAADLPLSPVKLKKIFKIVLQEIKNEPEWEETLEVLSYKPREVEVYFCRDPEMRFFQKRYRKLDRTTDVLSFAARDGIDVLEGVENSLGSIVLSVDTVQRNAKRARRKYESEFLEVLIHSLLHLVGCDHVRGGAKARRMRSLQRTLFQRARRAI